MITKKIIRLFGVSFFVFFFALRCSDGNERKDVLEVILKLKELELNEDFENARKYINIDSVYGKIADKEGRATDEIWKEEIIFFNNLSRSPKFDNSLDTSKFNITVEFKNQRANVEFVPKYESNKKWKFILIESGKKNWEIVGKYMVGNSNQDIHE